MVLYLDQKIEVEIKESGRIKEKLEITYRYPTKEEEKELKSELKRIKKLIDELTKLNKKIDSLQKRIEYAERLGEFKKAEELLDKKEALESKVEKITQDVEKAGGENWGEEIAKKRFEMLVGGKDYAKLQEIAEVVGYTKVLAELDRAREELEGKQLRG